MLPAPASRPDLDGPPPPPVDDRPLPPRRTRVWWVLGPLLGLCTIGIVLASFVRAPYVVFAPGSSRATEPLITVPKDKTHRSDGSVMFLTVSVVSHPTYMQALWGWIRSDIDVFPYKAIYGNQTNDQSRAQDRNDMNQSKLVAAKVALDELGYPVKVRGTGVLLQAVEPGLPVTPLLKAGDTIVAIDGSPTLVDDQMVAAIAKHRPGQVVTLTVEPKGSRGSRMVRVALSTRPGTKDTPILGVQIQTRDLRFTLPFKVGIDSGQVGGPSAGLAFTLGVLDQLTPGSLTGGHKVAVTGAMSADGQVEPVGGVRQKAVAARHAGAELMLVPPDEYEDARSTAGSMKVVKVSTLHDALVALAKLGGNGLELGKPGAGT